MGEDAHLAAIPSTSYCKRRVTRWHEECPHHLQSIPRANVWSRRLPCLPLHVALPCTLFTTWECSVREVAWECRLPWEGRCAPCSRPRKAACATSPGNADCRGSVDVLPVHDLGKQRARLHPAMPRDVEALPCFLCTTWECSARDVTWECRVTWKRWRALCSRPGKAACASSPCDFA